MSNDEQKSRLKGIFSIVVTPFGADGAFDFKALGENIERTISLGYDGLLIGGTYGEFPVMTAAERGELFRRAMDAAKGRIPVMLCPPDALRVPSPPAGIELVVPESDVDFEGMLAAQHEAFDDPSTGGNPVPMTPDKFAQLYRNCIDGMGL